MIPLRILNFSHVLELRSEILKFNVINKIQKIVTLKVVLSQDNKINYRLDVYKSHIKV